MKKAIIIGGGPAGLTAAYELSGNTDIVPIVFESNSQVGGISKTVVHRGYRLDLGGHRFFSKSEKIMSWWADILPVSGEPSKDDVMYNRQIPVFPGGPDPEQEDLVMLIRRRCSHIFYERKYYPYPLTINQGVMGNLGICKTVKIGLAYIQSLLKPIRPELTLEDFLINHFGKVLYSMFFEDYTRKVWGRECKKIDASWGHQRIKGLSVKKVVLGALQSRKNDITQKNVETSLINYFLYPKYGPGQLWEEVARRATMNGMSIFPLHKVEKVFHQGRRIEAVEVRDLKTGILKRFTADYFLSTMPLKDLILCMVPRVPRNIEKVASLLPYRHFVIVGMLLDDANLPKVEDNWLYIQETDVKMGRIQLFNNWSPYLVPSNDKIWLGIEYFTQDDDNLWLLSDEEMKRLAVDELIKLDLIEKDKWARAECVIRVPKAYPAYWGGYEKISLLREFSDTYENLFLIGRNGMHRYNNQDHSMLSAMEAVKNIVMGTKDKGNIWKVNAEYEYHEDGCLK